MLGRTEEQDIVVHDLLNVTLKPLLGVDLAGLGRRAHITQSVESLRIWGSPD